MAAELVGPTGKVILSDGAEAMVAAAQANADRAGATNVETKAMEAEWIDLSTASVDGVLCRWGYMLLADPETALRETRRVLKPDGRLALAAWDDRSRNPQFAVLQEVLSARGLGSEPEPGAPGTVRVRIRGADRGPARQRGVRGGRGRRRRLRVSRDGSRRVVGASRRPVGVAVARSSGR